MYAVRAAGLTKLEHNCPFIRELINFEYVVASGCSTRQNTSDLGFGCLYLHSDLRSTTSLSCWSWKSTGSYSVMKPTNVFRGNRAAFDWELAGLIGDMAANKGLAPPTDRSMQTAQPTETVINDPQLNKRRAMVKGKVAKIKTLTFEYHHRR
jgi:hypothetical protein